MRFLLMIVFALMLAACTHAGPYVTHISRTKDGQLMVEKCMLNHNAFMGTVDNENCTTQKI